MTQEEFLVKSHNIVTYSEWEKSCREHLVKEKEFTRLRDQLSQARRELPWTKIDKEYKFDTLAGFKSLDDLFEGRSQLIISHFMFAPDWDSGCPSCSFWADTYNNINVHLNARDINMVVVSSAPLKKLQNYKERMGWGFNWVSSFKNNFNSDFGVTFTEEEMNYSREFYNFKTAGFLVSEAPGTSVLYKNENGEIFRTYSCYARGQDILNGAYNYIDMTPKGRDEDELPMSMDWLRRHDEYEM